MSGQMGSTGKGLCLVVLMVGLPLLGQCEGGRGYEEPLNCRRLECASYEVIHTQKDYEVRSYKNAMWMSTYPMNSTSYKDAANRGFNILFAYIQGNNREAAKIEMTAPVLVDIFPSTGPFCNSSFVVSFYVPHKYQSDPPLSNHVRAVRLPRHRYAAVRRFGGFMEDSNIPTQALALKNSLQGTPWESSIAATQSEGVTVPYSVAGFNSPYEYQNRVNEVIFWFDG